MKPYNYETEDIDTSQHKDKSQFEDILKLSLNDVGKGIRLLNLILDTVIFFLFFSVFFFILGMIAEMLGFYDLLDFLDEDSYLWNIIGILMSFAYYAFFESLLSVTPGKLITKTIVVTDDGDKPAFKTILIRTLCRLVPFEAFTFLTSSRGFHDSQSKTRVITLNNYRTLRALTKK